ncbi:MAG: hypothetical protein V3T30_07405, partial [Thermodesulfobacteriota bacterium]
MSRRVCSLLVAVFILALVLFPGSSKAADPFALSVADSTLADPTKALSDLNDSVSVHELYSALSLSTPVFKEGNAFSVNSSLTLFGTDLSFSGVMKLNPGATSGAAVASLSADLTSGSLTLGTLTASAATLEMVIVNGDDGNAGAVYARITPKFTVGNVDLNSTVSINATDAGLTFLESLTKTAGAELKLIDFIPDASALTALSGFSFESLTRTAYGLSVTGRISGQSVTVADDLTKEKSFTVTGNGLKLTNFISEASALAALSAFAFEKLTYSTDSLTVVGKISGQAVTVVKDLTGDSAYTVTGAGLKLTDFIKPSSSVPALSEFAFSKLTHSSSVVTVAGEINGEATSVVFDLTNTKSYTVTGTGLTLKNFVSDAKSVPFLSKYVFTKMTHSAAGIVIDGQVGGRDVTVTDDLKTKKTFSLTGAELKLTDFISDASDIAFFKEFDFKKLVYSDSVLTVTGEASSIDVTITDDLTKPDTYSATGVDLILTDFVAEASAIPFLSNFAFESMTHSGSIVTIAGKVGGKAVTVTDDQTKKKSYSVTGAGL